MLFHWAAPGYLMLFPLLGDAVARRLDRPAVRRLLAGTAVFVVLGVAVVATQVRFDWLRPVIAAVARKDPDIDAVDWTSLRDELAARNLLRPGMIVGVPDWRDAGKIAYALGPDVTTLCLNRDARQFGIAWPPARFIGADMLILAPEHGERVVSGAWVPHSTASRDCPMHRSAMPDARCGRWRYSRQDGCASGLLRSDGIILAR